MSRGLSGRNRDGRNTVVQIALFAVIALFWRWIWGPCWNPLETSCFEGVEFGDHIQHFYGWLAYAEGNPSSVVPPLIRNWTWPIEIPLIYTDPIPLAAMVMRPLTRMFAIRFQYFSLLSLSSMMITAVCGYRLSKRFLHSEGVAFTLGLLLALAPTAVVRMPGHEALSLQFILVAAITLLVLRVQPLAGWILLFLVAPGLHAYLAALLIPFALVRCLSSEIAPSQFSSLFIVHLGRAIPAFRKQLGWLPRATDCCLLAATLLVAMRIFGYGHTGNEIAQETQLWSANMLALLDSQDRSSVIPGLSRLEPLQWEGFSYLGLGTLGFAVIAIYHTANAPKSRTSTTIFPSPPLYWGVIVASFVFALGMNFLLGDLELLSIESAVRQMGIDRLYFLFRATGRFIWPAYYSIVIWAFLTVATKLRNHKVVALVALIAMLDIHVPTMLLTRQTLKQHYRSGVEWRESGEPKSLELRQLIASSDLLLNATGDPNYKSEQLPLFFVQASNPTIYTNYRPYIPRKPQTLDRLLSADSCQLVDTGIQTAAQRSMERPLFILPAEAAGSCKHVTLEKRFDLEDGVALYSPRNNQ